MPHRSLLDSALPLVAAPMAGGPTTIALADAVAQAGGFPFLAAEELSRVEDGVRLHALRGAERSGASRRANRQPKNQVVWRDHALRGARNEPRKERLAAEELSRVEDGVREWVWWA